MKVDEDNLKKSLVSKIEKDIYTKNKNHRKNVWIKKNGLIPFHFKLCSTFFFKSE